MLKISVHHYPGIGEIYTSFIIGLLLLCFIGQLFAAEQTQQNSVNFVDIIESANFANATYQSEADITEFVHSRNYVLTQYRTIPEIQIAYFIATNELTRTQVIAVRGTSNIENMMVDIELRLTLDEYTGLRLHEGFSIAAKQVYSGLQPLLKKDYVINTTGHSLGGAVALILAMYLDKNQFTVGQVTTFGQPKVTNISGAKNFQQLNVIRVVTPLDLVPLVPLFDPLDISNIDIYWHAGKEVLLLPDTRYSILQGVSSMLRATKFTQKALSEENLKSHRMAVYLEELNKKSLSNELVPYKNSFNLFNLLLMQ